MYQPPYKGGLPTHPMEPLHAITGWLTFLGWMFIVIGALYCLTIIGVIIGWLPLWTGILLKGAEELSAAVQNSLWNEIRHGMPSHMMGNYLTRLLK